MRPRSEYVQLEAGEDINSVRDRLSFIRGQRVLIVWPEEGTALQRKLDLVLLQREAMRRAIRLALVTHDPIVIQHANELNISTFETIGASERARWKRGRSRVFMGRWQKPRDEPEPGELKEVASRVRAPRRAVSRARRVLARLTVLVILISAVAAAGYIIVPGATVTIMVAHQNIEVVTEITADPDPNVRDVDVENGVIPITKLRVETEATGTIETTGTEDLADIPAKGSVVFINQTEREVDIPAGTTVSTSAGTPILFRTTQDAKLAAGIGQQLEVPVEALPSAAGTVGNVDSGLINTIIGPLDSSLTVRNIAPTSGGETSALPSVTVEDQERLLLTVRQQLQSQAYTAMLPNLRETQFIVLETLKIAEERRDWTDFSARPGEIADTLTLSMRAVVDAVAIDRQMAQQIAFARLATQIPRGRVIKPESISYDCCPVVSIGADGRITLRITGSGQVTGQVNIGQLQERLAGRPTEEALDYLLSEVDLAENATPQITLSPDWFDRMPILPIRIDIRLQEIS